MAGNAGVPPDFAKYVFADWSARGGKDAGGVIVSWSRYIAKRWGREQVEWKAATHKGNKKHEQKSGKGSSRNVGTANEGVSHIYAGIEDV